MSGSCCHCNTVANTLHFLFSGRNSYIHVFVLRVSATNRTLPYSVPQIITASVCTVVCLVAVILLAIITIKSHCCVRRYSRKQRIFLYLLVASLGSLLPELLLFTGSNCHILFYLHTSFAQIELFVFCWAALYLCFDVFVTLRRIEFRGPNLCSNITEVCFLLSIAAVSAGYTAVLVLNTSHHSNIWCWFSDFRNGSTVDIKTERLWVVPLGLVTLIGVVCTLLVLVQLRVACRKVEAREVVNRLRSAIAETVILFVFSLVYFISLGVVSATVDDLHWNDLRTFLLIETPLSNSIIPFGFLIFFGRKMLQELCCQCCCRRYGKRRGYGPLQGGIFSVQNPASSTTRTYYTCDDSQPSEWFRAGPAPGPPVQQ